MLKVDFDGLGPAYKSYMGAAVSVTYVLMVCIFLFHKLLILFDDSATRVTSRIVENAIHETEKFNWEDNLFVAVALTHFKEEEEIIEDPTYGELVFEHFSWDTEARGNFKDSHETIETHPCSEEELGLLEGQGPDYFHIYEE